MVNHFLTALSVCHSVLPDFKNSKLKRMLSFDSPDTDFSILQIDYQASSPDEKALVIAAKNLSYFFYGRKSANIYFKDLILDGQTVHILIDGIHQIFHLYLMIEFNSTRKRMSVIIHDPRDGKIKLYCKGADNVIFERLSQESRMSDFAGAERCLHVQPHYDFCLKYLT